MVLKQGQPSVVIELLSANRQQGQLHLCAFIPAIFFEGVQSLSFVAISVCQSLFELFSLHIYHFQQFCSFIHHCLLFIDGNGILAGLCLIFANFSGELTFRVVILFLLLFPPLFLNKNNDTMIFLLKIQFCLEGGNLQLQLIFVGGELCESPFEIVDGEGLTRLKDTSFQNYSLIQVFNLLFYVLTSYSYIPLSQIKVIQSIGFFFGGFQNAIFIKVLTHQLI